MLVLGFVLCMSDVHGQYFPLIYGNDEYVSPVETVELLNGEFMSVIAVRTEVDGDTELGTQLLRFNDEGIILDVVVLTVDSITPTALKRCDDGSLLLLCQKTINAWDDIRFPMVYKLSETGDILWMTEYPFRVDFDANDILVLEGDEFIFSATDYDSSIVNYDMLVRCDQDGDTLWTREYIEFENEYARRLRLDYDGKVLVVGNAQLGFSPDDKGFLRKVDGVGETLWRRLHSIPDTSLAYRDVLPLDGEYVIIGIVEYTSGYVRHIDSSGELITSQFIGTDENIKLSTVDILENEDIVISGWMNSDDGNGYDVYLCILEDNLEIVVEENYGGSESDSGRSSFVTSNQQILISARSESFNAGNNREAYYLLVDTNGDVLTSLSEYPSNLLGLQIFPNPSAQGVSSYFISPLSIDVLTIYDGTGRVVLQTRPVGYVPNEKHPLPIEHLEAGVYFLVVNNSNQRLSLPFIVQ